MTTTIGATDEICQCVVHSFAQQHYGDFERSALVPAGVVSYEALHDHCDANWYMMKLFEGVTFGRPADDDPEVMTTGAEIALANRIAELVDHWLADNGSYGHTHLSGPVCAGCLADRWGDTIRVTGNEPTLEEFVTGQRSTHASCAAIMHDVCAQCEESVFQYDECSEHGMQRVAEIFTGTGFAGGLIVHGKLACGCSFHDESDDVAAAY